ncbi:uncharacterized protein LOC135137013 [Zophobas morio]|uniref:uncharacterized protein LOC135137013 n=1 Tax=Zophobas morio TaxID=2755281 RepID=UPI0030830966
MMVDQIQRRSLAGNIAIAFFAISFILITIAFATPNWLDSDYRTIGAKLDHLGLWTHCFRSPVDPYDFRDPRYVVNCRWIYEPFTTRYDQIRYFLVPSFMVATQSFFTLCFISVLVSAIVTLSHFWCCSPNMKQSFLLTQMNAYILLGGGLCGGIAVIVFASLAIKSGWMPGPPGFLGWSFALACVGVIACLVASVLFWTDWTVQRRTRGRLMWPQARFELERPRA